MIYHNVLVYLMIVPQCISIISPEKSHCKSTPAPSSQEEFSEFRRRPVIKAGHWECLCACAALRVFLAVHIGNNLFCYNCSYSQLEFSALELTYLHYCLVIKSSCSCWIIMSSSPQKKSSWIARLKSKMRFGNKKEIVKPGTIVTGQTKAPTVSQHTITCKFHDWSCTFVAGRHSVLQKV